MDIKKLRYFLTIANEGQITRAAKKLHIAQPPLSKQLKILEDEVGFQLFERNKKVMELTPAGKLFYKKAKLLVEQMDEMVLEVKEIQEGVRGVLTVGYVKSCFAYLPERIRHFQKHFPQVTFQLREGAPYQIGELLKQKEIELGLVRLPMEIGGFSSHHFPKEPFVAVFPKEWVDPQKLQSKLTLVELKDIPLLLLHRIHGSGVYEKIVKECRRNGFDPNIVCESSDSFSLLSLVSSGIGATIVPKSTVLPIFEKDVAIIEIEGFAPTSEAAIIWDDDRFKTKSMLYFLETFKEKKQSFNTVK